MFDSDDCDVEIIYQSDDRHDFIHPKQANKSQWTKDITRVGIL